MTALTRKLRRAVWTLNGHMGRTVPLDTLHKVTILITYYSPARMQHASAQVRNALKCSFVERVIVSNHNPTVQIEDIVKARDKRLVLLNQPVRRGCGYRWTVAAEFKPEYLLVIDDDVLLYPSQIARLFQELVANPQAPHGFTGMLYREHDTYEYHEREEVTVDFLCEVYAVTGDQLARYRELERAMAADETLAHMIASAADFMVISQAGTQKPKIHNAGRLLRCETFNQSGVAVHKEANFGASLSGVYHALIAEGAAHGSR